MLSRVFKSGVLLTGALIAANAWSAAPQFAYIPGLETTGYVSVVNTESSYKVTDVYVGASPSGIAIDSYGQYIYVSNRESSTVSKIDAFSNRAATTSVIGVTGLPWALVLDDDNTYLFIATDAGIQKVGTAVLDMVTMPSAVTYSGNILKKTDGDLYGANGPYMISASTTGISLLDSDGTELTSLNLAATSGFYGEIADVINVNSTLYVSHVKAATTSTFDNYISIIDIADPANPTLVMRSGKLYQQKGENVHVHMMAHSPDQRFIYVLFAIAQQYNSGGSLPPSGHYQVYDHDNSDVLYKTSSLALSKDAIAVHPLAITVRGDGMIYLVKKEWGLVGNLSLQEIKPTPIKNALGTITGYDFKEQRQTVVSDKSSVYFYGDFIGPPCDYCDYGTIPKKTTQRIQASAFSAFELGMFIALMSAAFFSRQFRSLAYSQKR